MSLSAKSQNQRSLMNEINDYAHQARGLTVKIEGENLFISQKIDKKSVVISNISVADVLHRTDETGKGFLQVNFSDNRKVLITDTLIGFKPTPIAELDMARLPRVVTTPDIQSIFDAIQEALHAADDVSFDEVEVLRRVFEAVVIGGEAIGFDLSKERGLMKFIPRRQMKASA